MDKNNKKHFYLCCPLLNKKCDKKSCYINNGPCRLTVDYNKSQEYLLEKKGGNKDE